MLRQQNHTDDVWQRILTNTTDQPTLCDAKANSANIMIMVW